MSEEYILTTNIEKHMNMFLNNLLPDIKVEILSSRENVHCSYTHETHQCTTIFKESFSFEEISDAPKTCAEYINHLIEIRFLTTYVFYQKWDKAQEYVKFQDKDKKFKFISDTIQLIGVGLDTPIKILCNSYIYQSQAIETFSLVNRYGFTDIDMVH